MIISTCQYFWDWIYFLFLDVSRWVASCFLIKSFCWICLIKVGLSLHFIPGQIRLAYRSFILTVLNTGRWHELNQSFFTIDIEVVSALNIMGISVDQLNLIICTQMSYRGWLIWLYISQDYKKRITRREKQAFKLSKLIITNNCTVW